MKKYIALLLIVCASVSLTVKVQCSKRLILTSLKTEYLNAAGAIQRTVDEKSVVDINETTILIKPGDEKHTMSGSIKPLSCKWTTPFRTGKTVMKAAISDNGGAPQNVTITIEGKDGTVTLLMEVDGKPDRKIRLNTDSFKEKN